MSERSIPHTVAIVAMGGSVIDYVGVSSQHGGRQFIADEVWTVNAMGGVIQHDRAFVMDDVQGLKAQVRAEGRKVATGLLEWLPTHPGPVYMPRAMPEVPGSVAYPIEDVLNAVGFPYLNNTVAYALAFALYLHAKHGLPGKVRMYGCDFIYSNRPVAEAGRANVEFLMGIAGSRGINVEVSQSTTLMDAHVAMGKRLYGYSEPVVPELDEEGQWRVRFPDREKAASEANPAAHQNGKLAGRITPEQLAEVGEGAEDA